MLRSLNHTVTLFDNPFIRLNFQSQNKLIILFYSAIIVFLLMKTLENRVSVLNVINYVILCEYRINLFVRVESKHTPYIMAYINCK